MANQTVQDVLTLVTEFHQGLGAAYRELARDARQPRVRMLADYLARAEATMVSTLEQYRREGEDETLGYWFKVAPNFDGALRLDDVRLTPDATVDDLTAIALRLSTRLVDIYRDIAERTTSPRVRDLFQSLMVGEEADGRRASRAALAADRE